MAHLSRGTATFDSNDAETSGRELIGVISGLPFCHLLSMFTFYALTSQISVISNGVNRCLIAKTNVISDYNFMILPNDEICPSSWCDQ